MIVIINYYLQAQVFTNVWRRTIKGVYSTFLIPIETNLAVHQEVAYPELLQRVWAPLCQLISMQCVTDLLDTVGEAVILLNQLPSRSKCSAYLQFCSSENARRNSLVV
jgi:hypothetical protein